MAKKTIKQKTIKQKATKIEATMIVLTLNGKDYPLSILEARNLKRSLDNIFGAYAQPYITPSYPHIFGNSLTAINGTTDTSISNTLAAAGTLTTTAANINIDSLDFNVDKKV